MLTLKEILEQDIETIEPSEMYHFKSNGGKYKILGYDLINLITTNEDHRKNEKYLV